ncbi:Protein FAM38B [Cricetulus griseus]|uniref:Protein FAM38B n=1 Tax=Cricetulus griseus TaxID=10029 RepID=G3H5H0_CRIGR|nr:Protein FAM38B [Cricetulus griseus]
MFIASLTIWLVCRNIVKKPDTEEVAQFNPDCENEELAGGEKMDSEEALIYEEDLDGEEGMEGELEESTKLKMFRRLASVASKLKEFIGNMITTAGKVVVTILLGSSGMMLPSLTSAVYFFVFLGLCTWWSWCRTFDPLLFGCLCVLLAIFTAGHLIGLYLYQFQFFQEAVPPNDYYARLFGIKSIIQTDCSSTWKIIVNPQLSWYHHANPILLLVMYYTLATLNRIWLQEPLVQDEMAKEDEGTLDCSSNQNTAERRRSLWYATQYPTDERKGLLVTVNGNPVDYHTIHPKKKEEDEDKKEGSEGEGSQEEKRSVRIHAMVTVFQFIMKQSYICALIAMMAWSITYHSWLTFVLLIWSCTLWMIRNRRKYAMISSPFMVVYANLLLVLQYIWSFELTEIKKVPGFLEKKNPGELASKILFTITFWLLLRQHLTEQKALREKEALLSEVKIGSQELEEREDEELQDIQVEGEPPEKAEEEEIKEERHELKKEEEEEVEEDDDQDIMKVLGNLVVALFIKYWIYVCGGMFFFVSFEGKIVMYKIIYMVLFLFCVALYQVHYEWWRKILKYFWMSVVIYTMLVLIFIYTYQFENFPGLWQNMTGLKKEKLEDLGLKQFTVAELFTRIFIPTSFLLVCILHLHYFHDRFLELTDLKSIPSKEDNTIYRLAHPEGSLPDLAVMNMTTSLDKPEVQKLVEAGEERPEECAKKAEKGQPGKDSDESEEEEDEEEESEEEETSDLRNKWLLVIDRLTVLFLKFLEYFHKLQVFMWWILELHIIKIVSSYIIWVTVKEASVSLFNYVFLISWAFALPYAKLRRVASSVCTVWTCVIIVCKMLYQLQTIKPENFSVNCSLPNENQTNIPLNELNKSLLYSAPVDPTEWVGLRKSSPLLVYLRNNLLMLAILAFEVTIYRHQEYYRGRNNLTAPVSKTIFHDITRLHLDDGLVNCAKYFINYFFYKFGLETCFLMSVNVIGQRMDFYAMIHACWLIGVLYRRRRKAIAEVWPKYCCFLACIITFQYFVCIGIPPAPCRDYPWRFKGANFNDNIIKWLYFPDFIVRPNPVFLVYDFMLLLCASLQRQIFEDENKAAVRIMAGDNVEICMNLDAASFSQHNPVPDFIHCRSYLDMSKVIIFSYLFWFVLTIIFITGTTRISIFCMGYLKACFYFLLFGGDLLLKPIKSILRYWDWLIAYNVFVITMKNILSIGACGYISALVRNSCWLIQAFSLACTVKGYKMPEDDSKCKLPSGEAGIIWDSICFAFLLLQRRVFMSYYFLHVVADIKASQILASRGAELFQATIVKAVKARIEEEKKSMDQLKRQMDRIKARQQKYKKGKERMLSLTQESGEGQDIQKLSEEDDEMVRSGDYYLFETDSEEEEEEELKKEDEEPPRKSAFQFVYQAWITDPKTALRQRRKEKKKLAREEEKGRRKGSGEDNIIKRIFNILKFTWVLFLATVDSFTTWLNSISREHIDISTVLRIERCMLTREIKKTKNHMVVSRDDSSTDKLESSILPPLTHELTASELLMNKMFHDDEYELEESEKFYVDQPRFLLLFYAMYNTLVARSEMVCYFVIILNHMISASIITLLLPILIFLWAMLSVPRPSRRFWMMAIVYTECHGLWDEDDIVDSGTDKEESDDELSLDHDRRGSSDSLKSINLAASVESVHVTFPEQPGPIRRKRSCSSSQISPRSSFSSNRSKRGSTSTRNSSQRGSSVLSIKQKSKRELYMEKLQEHLIKAKAFTIKKTLQIYIPIRQFFYDLIHPDYSAVTDVYVLMFLADTVDFIIIVFGFWAFGKHSAAADITSSLSEDQVPGPFLVMVLIQFGTMVVDRALYLRKTVLGKVIFQVILVFGIHFWMFFILPSVTERKFSQNLVAQLWYFVKCVYFGLSAYQIRCGYPTRVLGNFLTKSYNYVNLFLFQGFRLVPFLTELRAVMDWVWTDTTLSLSSWICVEDIYAHIFILKCWRESEKRYPQPRGQKKKKAVKYGMGGMIIVLLICIVWFPLLFMSLIKSVAGVINQPLDVSVTITLGGYQPIFTMSAQQSQLKVMDNTKNMTLGAKAEIATDKLSFPLANETRNNIAKMIAGNDTESSNTPVTIEKIYPYYVKAPSDSNSKPIKQLLSESNFMNITIILFRDNVTKSNSEWWVLNLTGNRIYNQGSQALELVVFNDKVSPPSLGFLAGYGIMGLYASVVLVIGKFVREFFSGISHSIMFEELPNVDRILKLCTDIFLVRETGELELEEDLYAKLIFLYRSPETMIKWTREKTN